MRRLHPRSAVVRVGRSAIQGAIFGLIIGTTLAGMVGLPGWAIPLLAPLGATVAGGFALVRYYRFRYEIADGTLAVESGVLARQSREIPLGRIQNVDTKQGVLNRLLGLSVVAFETAGGSTTEATLDAVDPAEADRLRRLIHRHGTDAESPPESNGPVEADEATDTTVVTSDDVAAEQPRERRDDIEELFAFGLPDLLTYAVVSIRPAAPALLVAGLPLGGDIIAAVVNYNIAIVSSGAPPTVETIVNFGPLRLVGLLAVTGAQFILTALLLSIVLTVIEYFDFRLVRDGDDLRYQRGLLRRYTGTIPLSKVQSVTVQENVLMRQFGFATLVVETAGYSGGSRQSTQGVAIPLAPRETVYELARDIEPFDSFEFERAPKRARRRYVARFAIVASVMTATAYAVDTLLFDSGFWVLFLGLFVVVLPAAYLRWRHRGFALEADVLATRSGFWRRTTQIVPYYRVQTVFVGRSPFQRRRDLATVTADTASTSSILGGSATAYDIDDAAAGELRNELRRRLYTDLLDRRHETTSVDK